MSYHLTKSPWHYTWTTPFAITQSLHTIVSFMELKNPCFRNYFEFDNKCFLFAIGSIWSYHALWGIKVITKYREPHIFTNWAISKLRPPKGNEKWVITEGIVAMIYRRYWLSRTNPWWISNWNKVCYLYRVQLYFLQETLKRDLWQVHKKPRNWLSHESFLLEF